MIQAIAKLITQRRGLFLTLGAYFSRAIFAIIIFGSIYLATQLTPQESFTYRRSEVFRGPTKNVVAMAFRDDGEWLAAASKDGNIFLWDFSQDYEPNMRGRARIILPLAEGSANDLIFTHDNQFLVTGGTDQEIKFWDTSKLNSQEGETDAIAKYIEFTNQAEIDQTFLRYETITAHSAQITKFALSDNQQWLASVDSTGIVYLWPLTSHNPKVIATQGALIDYHRRTPITDIEFSPSGRWLAIADQAGKISLWDLTQAKPMETLSNPSKIFTQSGRVNDIAFDLSYNSETKDLEKQLFSVGADEDVHMWDIWGTDQETINLRKLHDTTTVKVGLTRDPNRGTYWMVTADKSGKFVFWDMNRFKNFSTGRIGSEFYLIDGADGEITDMTFNLIPSDNEAIRHLMLTSSADRSAQLWSLTLSKGAWNPIRLRPMSGRISTIVVNPSNEYILTAGTDDTIRLWETVRVADTSQAFPTTYFIKYLVPVLLTLVFALHTTSTFIMKTQNITSHNHALGYILSAIFGWNFRSFWLFIGSLFVPIWPQMIVEKGKIHLDSDQFLQLDAIGGPGKVIIRPGNVVTFQTIRTQTAVCTNQTYRLRPFERIRNIISLEDQYYEVNEIETYTRDGILITLKNIRMRYRVKFKENEDSDSQNYRARYQNYPDPVDPEALDKALNMRFWNSGVQRTTLKKIIRFVNMRPLDYFTAPQTFNLKEEVRENFRDWVLEQNKGLLNSFGAEMIWLDVGVIEINPDVVRQTRQKVYNWEIRKEAEQLRAQGASKAEAYRELGRLKGEWKILNAIINELDRWNTDEDTNLAGGVPENESQQGTPAPGIISRKRTIFLTRMSELLRTYLRTSASDQSMLDLEKMDRFDQDNKSRS